MSNADACPRCGSKRIVFGEFTRGRTIGVHEPNRFRAFASKMSWLRKGAEVSPNMVACSQCGLVWGEVKVSKLFEHLESFPSDDLAHWLKSSSDTPI